MRTNSRTPDLRTAGWLVAVAACAPTDPVDERPIFVRDGILVRGDVRGEPVGTGWRLLAHRWAPGERVVLGASEALAPERASCVPLFHVPLGDVGRLVAGGEGPPNTALAFSPDGARLAVGSALGEVLVVDAWSGAVLARRSVPEAVVKVVRWSPDGATLYLGEQSPDATLRAVDPGTLEDRWQARLADTIGTSTIPRGADVYALYTLPGVTSVVPLADGSVVAVGTHAWPDADGVQWNLSIVVHFDPLGRPLEHWPATPADATFLSAHADALGSWVAIAVGRSATGPPPGDLPVGGVQILALPELTPVLSLELEPLAPAFTSTFVWDGLDVDRTAALAGFDDGRILVRSIPDGTDLGRLSTGAPVLAGDVPIYAGIGWARLVEGGLVYGTSGTRIPWGAADPARRPPTAHPQERTVAAVTRTGVPLWSWTGDAEVQGLTVSPTGHELVVGSGDRETDHREDLFGALVFSLASDGGSGDERLLATCPTAGPVFFRHAVTADGRIAVTEHPFLDARGDLQADYQVTVLR